ncbi:hypothetical protein [Aquincola sp. J276]|uniref:hypothetical protein n=1 Tax=Aquincola sp. J276 TaxID=2898432 RepID=UPI002150AABF|nr:hypothetical protein [Aquincola sp. J276]MCR5865232.1 hypothetical protein [Aquincola sp. J276]
MSEAKSATYIALPSELKAYLRQAAIKNMRSIAGEVLFRLEQSRRREESAAPQAAQQQ